jgi:hypothetical protein
MFARSKDGFRFLILSSLAAFSLLAQANSSPISSHSEVEKVEAKADSLAEYSDFELALFSEVLQEVSRLSSFNNKLLEQGRATLDLSTVKGNLNFSGDAFSYLAHSGVIEWIKIGGKSSGALNSRKLIQTLKLKGNNSERCPQCLILAGGVIISQAMCMIGEAAASYGCSSSCAGGVQSYSRNCAFGYASVECICLPTAGVYPPLSGSVFFPSGGGALGGGGLGGGISGTWLPWNFTAGGPWGEEHPF